MSGPLAGAAPHGAGVDVVAVARVAAAIARHPRLVARVFTDREVADCLRGGVAPTSAVAAARFAARFAAKEAARKALGASRRWHDVEVVTGPDGAPHLEVGGRWADADLSLSHDAGLAVAFVVRRCPCCSPANACS